MLPKSTRTKIALKTSLVTAMAVSIIAFSHQPAAMARTSIQTNIVQVNKQNTYRGTEKDNHIIQFKEKAAAIVIGGKSIIYVNNKETAEKVVNHLKLKYVNKAELAGLAANESAFHNFSVKENEKRLVDVHFANEISIVEKSADFNHILSEGAAEKLLDRENINVIIERVYKQNEVIPFTNQIVNTATLAAGETKEKQQGKNGIKEVTYHIVEQNGVVVKQDQVNEQIIVQPKNQIIMKGTKQDLSQGTCSFVWPTDGGYISSGMGYRWGAFHKGIDIARPNDRTIRAADNGVVVFAAYSGGFGNKIMIDHQNGFVTIYGHLAVISVHVGQTVTRGTAIGVMGATGDATGVHLHFEVHENGVLKNPLDYLN